MSPGTVPAQIDLERAFERLGETSRAVVWLHDVEGYTHEEIA
jgi:DNA-directed RNA polymerase specialized sigma24 family protein